MNITNTRDLLRLAGNDGFAGSHRFLGTLLALTLFGIVINGSANGQRRAARVAPRALTLVTLDDPAGASKAIVGRARQLYVGVFARAPIERVQLWDGDRLVDELHTRGTLELHRALSWVPDDSGTHVLSAVVSTRRGRAVSRPVWIRVRDTGGRVLPPPPEQTIRSGPLTATIDPDECFVEVASDGPAVALEVARPNAPSSVAWTILDEGDSSRLPLGSGLTLLVAKELRSPFLPVFAPRHCTESAWDGDFRIAEGTLELSDPAPNLFLTVSTDGSEQIRIPVSEQEFLTPGSDPFAYDVGESIPSLQGEAAVFQAWSQQEDGGDASVVGEASLGLPDAFQKYPSEPSGTGSPLNDVVGAFATPAFDWIVKPAPNEQLARQGGFLKPWTWTEPPLPGTIPKQPSEIKKFRWDMTYPDVSLGVMQFSTVPLSDGSDLAFLGYVGWKTVPVGEFTIDFAALLDGKPAAPPPKSTSALLNELHAAIAAGAKPMPAAVYRQPLSATLPLNQAKPIKLFLRVIPVRDGKLLEAASNDVSFHVAWSKPGKIQLPTDTPEYSFKVDFGKPTKPNSDYRHCVRVVENPFGTKNPVPDKWKLGWGAGLLELEFKKLEPVKVGDTICADYDPPDENFFTWMANIEKQITKAWDFVVKGVQTLKEKIAKAIANYSGCSALAGSLCADVIEAAADAYLASHGIPPTLPTSDQVKQAAKGELVDLVTDKLAKECGLAEAACKQAAEKVLDDFLDEAEKQVSAAAYDNATKGDWDLWLNPEIRVVPEPASQLVGPRYMVTVTRERKHFGADPDTCTIDYQTLGKNEKYSPSIYSDEIVLQGRVFTTLTKDYDFRDLPVGQSMQVTAYRGIEDRQMYPNLPGNYNALGYYLPGASIRAFVTGSCMQKSISSPSWTQTLDPTEPEDIKFP